MLLQFLPLLALGGSSTAVSRQKRFLDDNWWSQFRGGISQLEERSNVENLSGWAAKVEEEMRPALAKLGARIGGLMGGIVEGLGEGQEFQHSMVDRSDGGSVVTGDHTLGLEDLGQTLGKLGASIGGEMGGLGARLGEQFGHMGSHSLSSPAIYSTSSFSSSDLSHLGGMGGMKEFDPFSIFGIVRKKWYQGEGVCTEREVVDEEEVETREGTFNIFQMNMKMTTCRDEDTLHECRTEVTESGVRRTVVERQVCCHGHRRIPGHVGCEVVDLQDLPDTVRDLGTLEFFALLEDNNLLDHLDQNMTIFAPSDDAVEDFHRDLLDINKVGVDEDNTKETKEEGRDYNIDDGLTSRRRRELSLAGAPRLQDILLSHIVKGFLPTTSMDDEATVETLTDGGRIRLTVYNTHPQKVVMANCARVTSRDNMATNGIVHMVDKVLVPTQKTISDLLRTNPGLTTFFQALEQTGLAEDLAAEGQFTVFAPTDEAMAALDTTLKQRILSGSGCSADILRNHILPNVICSGIVEGKVKTNNLLSEMLLLSRTEEDEVSVEGARLVVRDVMATNGVLHVIERVLVPKTAKTVLESLSSRPTILSLLEDSGLTDQFRTLDNSTLFLPTEKAMSELPENFLQELRENPEKLKEFVQYHVTQPNRCLCELSNNLLLPSVRADQQIRVNSYGVNHMFGGRRVLTAQCARIVGGEEKVCGATIHSVDKVLLPPTGDLLQIVSSNPEYSRFLLLLASTNLTSLLSSSARTILVPTDEAFEQLEDSVVSRLEEDQDFARETVERHLLKEVLCCAGIHRNNLLFNSSRKRSASGHIVSVRRSVSGHLYADKAEISKCDMVANNGVAHQLDSVLLPVPTPPGAQERRDHGLANVFSFNPFRLF